MFPPQSPNSFLACIIILVMVSTIMSINNLTCMNWYLPLNPLNTPSLLVWRCISRPTVPLGLTTGPGEDLSQYLRWRQCGDQISNVKYPGENKLAEGLDADLDGSCVWSCVSKRQRGEGPLHLHESKVILLLLTFPEAVWTGPCECWRSQSSRRGTAPGRMLSSCRGCC